MLRERAPARMPQPPPFLSRQESLTLRDMIPGLLLCLCVGPAPPGLLSSWSTLLGVFPSHLTDLRDEVNYSVPQSSAKSKLKSQSSSASLEHTASTRDSMSRNGTSAQAVQNRFHPSGQLANDSEAVRFSGFCFSTEVLSFLPIGLYMLV